ncbi:phosphate acyltransferase PlsX [Mesoplasma lactucae]|uniref:Phosphate acyltransferase n=1 Tax=Mesoplasma lactucae ATCC 49193 TaxID=81460 RepID=A0A291IS62_9MOLU|nr:phosphate acyltransferase PlsX [Mesoplasma lactucae]ATG97531.1 phosphate acyltransferase [Mesoplasma lactucae ATCC 49193]ATZ20011.1 glycerol-3-phosphate acyltransferase PlsX [Mesoplasma lactucae ATCC 49193]MCL8217038.1 Phosphate acyltransferase [Mesoplasma lactucae ATCC 49193]
MIKIAFDVMGSDNGADVAIEAGLKFLETHQDLELIFVGDEKEINQAIDKHLPKYKKVNKDSFSIFKTTEVIDSHGSILDIRRKKDASIVRTLEMVRDKKVDAMLTAGSSAAFIAGAQTIIGNIPGVKRSAFMPTIPSTVDGKVLQLLDAGANLDNTAEELLQFSQMASVYATAVNGVEKPMVGLMNIGEEASKGKELQKSAYKLLEADKTINFYGNIEPREILNGVVDIMVTDGFTGNIALKTAEGVARSVGHELKSQVKKHWWRKLAVLQMIPTFKAIGKKFNYKNHAGAILIGINGIVFKSHGSSDLQSFGATLRMTYDAVQNQVLDKLTIGMKGYIIDGNEK